MNRQATFVETPSHTDTSMITAGDAALRYIAALHGADVPIEPFSAAVTAQALASALHPYKTPHGREADSKMVMAISTTQQQTEPVPHSPIDLQSIPDRQRSFTAENIRDIAHDCIRIGDNDQAAVVFAIADALRDGSLVIQPPAQQQIAATQLVCDALIAIVSHSGDPAGTVAALTEWRKKAEAFTRNPAANLPAAAVPDATVGKLRMLLAACNRIEEEAEEFEGPDGLEMGIAMDYWHEFAEALTAARKALAAAQKGGAA